MLRLCPYSRMRTGIPPALLLSVEKPKQSSLNSLITMFQAATRGSKGSYFAGDVQNSTPQNFTFTLGEEGLGSVGETQTVEGVECAGRNLCLIHRRFLFCETCGHASYPGIRLAETRR